MSDFQQYMKGQGGSHGDYQKQLLPHLRKQVGVLDFSLPA